MTTKQSAPNTTATAFRLAIILLAFPVALAYVLPALEAVQQFYAGNRAHWFNFWMIAVALEWLTLLIVLATVSRKLEYLGTIGFPLRLGRHERFIVLSVLLGIGALAVAGAGGPQDFLARLPAGVRMFIPPSDLEARLFWVFVSLTAAICEETLWRGVAITELRARSGSTLLAVLISSLSFVFFHGGLQQGPAVFAYRFVISLILSAVYLRTGNLRWVIAIHFLMDASALMAIQID